MEIVMVITSGEHILLALGVMITKLKEREEKRNGGEEA